MWPCWSSGRPVPLHMSTPWTRERQAGAALEASHVSCRKAGRRDHSSWPWLGRIGVPRFPRFSASWPMLDGHLDTWSSQDTYRKYKVLVVVDLHFYRVPLHTARTT